MIKIDAKPLKNQQFHGIILKDIDPLNQGRYRVWISELMHQIPNVKGLWCKNKTNNNSYNYKPIPIGTDVVVLFKENDFNTGVIVETNHDKVLNSLPHKAKPDDRDKVYNIANTDSGQHTFTMTTGSSSVPSNSVHLYANNKSVKIILNDGGVHIFSGDGVNISATDINIHASSKINLESGGDFNIKSGGNINLEAGGNVNNKGATVNVDGGSVNLKGSIVSSPIAGTISHAALAGGLGSASPPSPGSAGSAASNSGFSTKSPAEIG